MTHEQKPGLAVKGSGEGYWNESARSDRTLQHQLNTMTRGSGYEATEAALKALGTDNASVVFSAPHRDRMEGNFAKKLAPKRRNVSNRVTKNRH